MSVAELEQLRKIENVVRMGHVQSITVDEIVLDSGTIPTTPDTLHVDCAADGLEVRPVVPVFEGERITLEPVRTCQPTFSAAFVGHVEAGHKDEADKNEVCRPIPYPNSEIGWLRTTLMNMTNTAKWNSDPELAAWLQGSRLDIFSQKFFDGPPSDDQLKIFGKIGEHTPVAITNLAKLLADVPDDVN